MNEQRLAQSWKEKDRSSLAYRFQIFLIAQGLVFVPFISLTPCFAVCPQCCSLEPLTSDFMRTANGCLMDRKNTDRV